MSCVRLVTIFVLCVITEEERVVRGLSQRPSWQTAYESSGGGVGRSGRKVPAIFRYDTGDNNNGRLRRSLKAVTPSHTENRTDNTHDALVSVFGVDVPVNQSLTNRLVTSVVTNHLCGSKHTCDQNHTHDGLCYYECMDCKCDDLCHFYGDCCPRKLFEYSPEVPSNRPKFVTCSGSNITQWGDQHYIFLVTGCPENTTVDKQTVARCEFPDIGIFTEATPVSNIATQITYANQFCARCHGIQEFQVWSQNVSCNIRAPLQEAHTRDELWRLVMTDDACKVKLISIPPPNLELRVCKPYEVDTCNVTGKWVSNVNPLAETLCSLYEDMVDYYTGSTPVSYRNVFCAICNGAQITETVPCIRLMDKRAPALSVLLLFSSPSDPDTMEVKSPKQCEVGQIYDPLSEACRRLSCPARRVLDEDRCEVPYLSSRGLGFSYRHDLRPLDQALEDTSDVITQYRTFFETFFREYENFIYVSFVIEVFGTKDNSSVDGIRVSGRFIHQDNSSVQEMEARLVQFMSQTWTYYNNDTKTNVSLLSTPLHCQPVNDSANALLVEIYPTRDKEGSLASFSPVGLDCSFLEYNLPVANFSYDPDTGTITRDDQVIYVNTSRVSLCNGTLQICSDVLLMIADNGNHTSKRKAIQNPALDPTLAIVSLVCFSLSLVSLFVTFVVFCLVAKLRTGPGKNTMALVFHLFWAQLVFLSLSNRVEVKTLCQVSAVLIHYLWLTTFTWMMALAYQMHKVFARFPSMASDHTKNQHLVWVYMLICDTCATIPVIICLAYYLISTDGQHMGYAQTICFLSDPWAIGVFFAAPLCIMLVFNGFCFGRILHGIGCHQEIENATEQSSINFLFIYIKLSVLFGFSWAFGLLAAAFNNLVLWYFFVLSTGSQGVFLFIAYCVNKRTWASFKASLSARTSTRSTQLSSRSSPQKELTDLRASELHSRPPDEAGSSSRV